MWTSTEQKMKFSINDFFSKCDQIHMKLWIWSYLLKKYLMKTSFFVQCYSKYLVWRTTGFQNYCTIKKWFGIECKKIFATLAHLEKMKTKIFVEFYNTAIWSVEKDSGKWRAWRAFCGCVFYKLGCLVLDFLYKVAYLAFFTNWRFWRSS